MRFVYLVQGAAERLRQLSFPAGATVFALCYDEEVNLDFASRTLFDPTCSWAEGRNRLAEIAVSAVPDLDYLIISDDDVQFTRGSFSHFERSLSRTRPAIGQPLMPKARQLGGYNRLVNTQAALLVDEQLYGLHRSVIGTKGICPIVTEFDHISWHAPCLIFEYVALVEFQRAFHQYNDIVVLNTNHTWQSGETNYKIGQPGEAYRCFREWVAREYSSYDETVLYAFWRSEHRGVAALRYSILRALKLAAAPLILKANPNAR